MRAGLSMIQQTLTPEAAGVLNRSIAEAARRGHSQTTPLHVAATLLASPSGYLRQACIRSHPMSSHPLQCRALELCFSVALDRLPSAALSDTNAAAAKEPPISNALMAALKRAQAHQRRGCPEQQQQPLLAVKVELEQLVVSILDDPSVSRVMREASFSSPAVKATIEKSLASTSSSSTSAISSSPPTSTNANATAGNSPSLAALGLRPAATTVLPANRNLYLNPRLQQTQYLQQQQQVASQGGGSPPNGEEDVRKVLEILTRTKKRNPVLVGDSNPEALMREVLQKLEKNQVTDRALRNLHVISFDRELPSDLSLILLKMKDLQNSIETHLCQCRRDGGGVVVNLGDLKWLVEAAAAPRSTQIQQQQLVSTVGQAVVAEMGKLLGMLREREGDADGGGGGRVWLIGAATCSTYLRCMVYHQTIENDWDLQAVPIAPKAPPHAGVIARTGSNGILSSPMESLASPGGSAALLSRPPMLEDRDPSRRTICPACTKNYELESAKLAKIESNNSSCNSETDGPQSLPRWLQAAKLHKESTNAASDQIQTRGQDLKLKQNKEELLKKWTETCSRLHPNFHHPTAATYRPPLSHDHPISGPQRLNPMLLRPLQPKPVLAPTLNHRAPVLPLAQRPTSPPRSPVGTDLALGQQNSKPRPSSLPLDQNHQDRVKESQGCTLDFFSDQQKGKFGSNLDADSFKRLFKGLTNEVGWQQDAASAVAAAVTQCRSGNGKRRAAGTNSWLLFMGPDKVGKKRMAAALSELLFGTTPVIVSLSSGSPTADGEDGESNTRFRGKTALDRLAEAVRRNPFSVFVLEDVDRSDMLVQGSIKRVMERGRLLDSHGREFSLGSGVYIIAANAVPESLRTSVMDSVIQCEEKIEAAANSRWQLEIMVGEKAGKRRAGEWMFDKDVRSTKARKERQMGLSLDLNLGLGAAEDETGEGSPNSSDLTTEHSHDYGRLAISRPSSWLLPADLIDAVDEAVLFRPVDFGALRRKVSDLLIGKFNSVIGSGMGSRLQVEEEALDRIVGGIWFGDSASTGFEEWMESVLGGSFQQLRRSWAAGDGSIIRLVAIKDGQTPSTERLPSRISIAGEGLF